jgi:hypothetical protein
LRRCGDSPIIALTRSSIPTAEVGWISMAKVAGKRRGRFKVLSQREITQAFEAAWNRNLRRSGCNGCSPQCDQASGDKGRGKTRVQTRKRSASKS